MKSRDKKLAVILSAATVFAVLVSPVMAEEAEVVRSFSTTSPSPGDEFTVTLSISGIQIGGIVETIPDGFTFPEHPSDYHHYEVSGQEIAFAVMDVTTEIKYKVEAPSSDIGAFSGFWEAFLNKINGTVQDADSDEEEEEEEEEEGEEDQGATPTPTSSSNVTGVSIEAGEEASLTFECTDLNVSKISIKVDKSVSGVEIVVQNVKKPENISKVSGISYSYFNITATNLTANVTAKIEFKVNKPWITDNNINETTIKLNRYNGSWTVLHTSKLGEDDVSSYFEAETPGFSLFAISGKKKVGASPTPTPEFEETLTSITTPKPEEGTPASIHTPTRQTLPAKTSAEERDTGLTMTITAITASIAIIGIATYFAVFRSRRKGGEKE
jgi:PGF-pre-PGF domain-containing protein